ncbi:CHASE3 domain-containing protein [Rhodoferax sp. UBA5149]|uniref:CHASE3 domain-containing protein n=1 Tax=Rhodoferax sp. UBA5149 TaxID=1947379 RepID=UPI0025EB592B|nr:CHASE3 domain-containing protein [Rhodoferax sp. UBA5149]
MNILTVVKHSPIVFALACLATIATALVSEGSYWRSVDDLNELSATAATRMSILGLTRSIVDAETGQRGYLLTGRKEYLPPYDQALKNVDESFRALDLHYADKPEHSEVLGKLHTLTEATLSEIAQTIRLHDEGKTKAVTELILSDIGKEKMEVIRTLSNELLEHEMSNIVETRSNMNHTLMLRRIGVAVFSVIGLLALFMYMRQTLMFEKQQGEVQRLLQAERDRLEIEVKHRTAQLTELAHHLQTAREDERHRLARDLHDELGALLTSAKLDAARIKSRLAGTAPEALALLAHLVDTLNSGIALGRRIIEDLRPSALSNLGLVATLEILAREFAEHSGVEVHCALEPVELEATAELMVYRLVQEAITNITKYARASHVWVNLAAHNRRIEVSIRDDGVGFDTTLRPSSAYGLVGMRFRVEAQGGTLVVVSAPGQGTLIQATLPESTLGIVQEPMHT